MDALIRAHPLFHELTLLIYIFLHCLSPILFAAPRYLTSQHQAGRWLSVKNVGQTVWTKLDRVVGSIKKTSWEVFCKCSCFSVAL